VTCGCRGGGLLGLRLVADALEAGRGLEADAALRPFLEFCGDVFGDEDDLRGAADELVLLGIGLGSDEGENGGAVGRSDPDPTFAGLHAGVVGDVETELVDEKVEAAVLVADEDVDAVQAHVRGRGTRWEGTAHGQDYKSKSKALGRWQQEGRRAGAAKMAAMKGSVCFGGWVCENVGARNYEHIVG
jgi:hypothetical protein